MGTFCMIHLLCMPYKNPEDRKKNAAKWRKKNQKSIVKWRRDNPNYNREWYDKNVRPFTKKPEGKPIVGGRDLIRERVRVKDKHTCQDCKRVWDGKERRFDVHHLGGQCGKKSRGYDRLSEMEGLITLCHRCHFNRPEHTSRRKK